MTAEEIDGVIVTIASDALASYRHGDVERHDALAFVIGLLREVQDTSACQC